MSSTPSAPSNFQAILEAALAEYFKKTGKDLRNHPLASEIDACDSAESMLAIFRNQASAFDDFRNGDPKLIKCLRPFVSNLYAITSSPALSVVVSGVSLVFPPASPIFSAISVLLSMPDSVKASYDALVEIFECVEAFVRRLMIYTKIKNPDSALTEALIKIMAELISVLAVATKQMNQGLFKRYGKKFLGEKEIESVLQRLDRLTDKESKAAVTQTLDIVHSLVNKVEVVMEGGEASTGDIHQTLVLMQETAMRVSKMERDQLQDKFRRWLSPPDPWTNHNIAREAHHHGTATWFTEGDMFGQWKSTGSLLWVNGLPGSGKTIISSSIIEDIRDACVTGLATLAIFYCDFRDKNKQNARNLLSSVLLQLCHRSEAFSKLLSSVYSTHGDGSQQPSIDALQGCLKSMLRLSGQGTLYLVIDALDECPNFSGYPTPREQALDVLQALVSMKLTHVHFCITSRPEIDIRDVLEPLATYLVPLHEQAGQKQDILDYIDHFVRSDRNVQRWREEDKQLVIDTLTEKARGMFRWVHCQIETLRRCFPPSIRRILGELPKTLDETYERTLLEIDAEKRTYAHRLFQCLIISIRPLHVKELSELFAVLPDTESTSGFNIGWRPEDPEEFILSACSTLVTIVDADADDDDNEKVVQFSHFSVREYLTSNRIANSAPVSHFHILPRPAHALLARACLSVLLQLDSTADQTNIQTFPLAQYAAEHWVDHARFEDISSDIRDGIDPLFDKDKPHFAVWIRVYDMDGYDSWNKADEDGEDDKFDSEDVTSTDPKQPRAVPLYYAALCGFHDLAERLLAAHPQDLNDQGGVRGAPLNAALHNGHLNIALLLLGHGADGENRGKACQTALYIASSHGYAEIVRTLIDRGADPNAQCDDWDGEREEKLKWTPLHVASKNGRVEIARMLLESGANVNYQGDRCRNPLNIASHGGYTNLVRLLLDHGADPSAQCDDWDRNRGEKVKWTPLHAASNNGSLEIARMLLEKGADANYQGDRCRSPLNIASRGGHTDLVQLLLDHGTNINAPDERGQTALHKASFQGQIEIVKLLLELGADVDVSGQADGGRKGWTPLLFAVRGGHLEVVQLLLNHGANVKTQSKVKGYNNWTALHLAISYEHPQVVKVLLERGADPLAQTGEGQTPFQLTVSEVSGRDARAMILQLISERTGESE